MRFYGLDIDFGVRFNAKIGISEVLSFDGWILASLIDVGACSQVVDDAFVAFHGAVCLHASYEGGVDIVELAGGVVPHHALEAHGSFVPSWHFVGQPHLHLLLEVKHGPLSGFICGECLFVDYLPGLPVGLELGKVGGGGFYYNKVHARAYLISFREGLVALGILSEVCFKLGCNDKALDATDEIQCFINACRYNFIVKIAYVQVHSLRYV